MKKELTMAEGTYEYECMRAELLGIEKPDYDEFIKNKQERAERVEEEQDIENLKEATEFVDKSRHISTGLDDLNSILQVTQRKINRFKASCGSLTNLLKIKMGHGSSSDSLEANVSDEVDESGPVPPSSVTTNGSCSSGEGRKSDLAKALDNNLDRLDSMLEKADNAQYSMAHQTKEMKRFLN